MNIHCKKFKIAPSNSYDSTSTYPSPNYIPFTSINSPKLWDPNTIHHVQIDGEQTEIGFLRRNELIMYIFINSSHYSFKLSVQFKNTSTSTISIFWALHCKK